jgi:transposase
VPASILQLSGVLPADCHRGFDASRLPARGGMGKLLRGLWLWVVERTFSWLSQNRRMSEDYERLFASAETFVYAAMIRL